MDVLDFGPKPAPQWNQEVTRAHAGEDGPCWRISTTREMFIQEQEEAYVLGGRSQEWWFEEFMCRVMEEDHEQD